MINKKYDMINKVNVNQERTIKKLQEQKMAQEKIIKASDEQLKAKQDIIDKLEESDIISKELISNLETLKNKNWETDSAFQSGTSSPTLSVSSQLESHAGKKVLAEN